MLQRGATVFAVWLGAVGWIAGSPAPAVLAQILVASLLMGRVAHHRLSGGSSMVGVLLGLLVVVVLPVSALHTSRLVWGLNEDEGGTYFMEWGREGEHVDYIPRACPGSGPSQEDPPSQRALVAVYELVDDGLPLGHPAGGLPLRVAVGLRRRRAPRVGMVRTADLRPRAHPERDPDPRDAGAPSGWDVGPVAEATTNTD